MIGIFLSGLAWAGAVAVGPNAGTETAFAPRRIAVLVGVQDYEDPSLQGLQFPEKDARDLGAVLGSPDVGGFDRVFVLSGREATTRAGLLNAFRVATADLQRDDTFVLYLSGHGTLAIDPIEGSRLYFMPADGRLERPESTGLAVADVEALVHELPARRRVLILDTCHNGRTGSRSAVSTPTAQLLSGFRGEPPAPQGGRDVSESEARLYAAQYWQPAMEDKELQNGVYTHFLIDALTAARGRADLDTDGLVDVMEAHQYARDRTMTWTGGLQIPRAEYRIVGREEIFLGGSESLRTSAERALIAACDAVLARAKLFVNGTPRGELPGVYAVDPGVQVVEVKAPDGRTLLRESVALAAGETLPIESMMRSRESTVSVLAGVAFHAGNDAVLPFGGTMQAVWGNPVRLAGPWRTEVQASIVMARGLSPVEQVDQTSGLVSLGVGFGPRAGSAWAALTASAHDTWRTSAYGAQAELSGAGGLALGLDLPVHRRLHLAMRLDGWAGMEPVYLEPSLTWGGALSVGVGSPLK